jgi:hypothetical protein
MSELSHTGPEPTLGIVITEETSTEHFSRVLLSVRRAGLSEARLLGPGPDGTFVSAPLHVVRDRDSVQSRPVRVRVRLGGYTLYIGREGQDIPRVRNGEDDHVEFDVPSLLSAVGERDHTSASVSYMSTVEAAPLIASIFAVAPPQGAVDVVVP